MGNYCWHKQELISETIFDTPGKSAWCIFIRKDDGRLVPKRGVKFQEWRCTKCNIRSYYTYKRSPKHFGEWKCAKSKYQMQNGVLTKRGVPLDIPRVTYLPLL